MSEVRVQLPYKPRVHQIAAHALRLVFRFLVLVWHRGAGKTVFAVAELVLAALSAKSERELYGYICPFLKQAKGVAWDYLRAHARAVPGAIVNEVELSVVFPNGAKVRLFGADNPDALRGLHFTGLVADEVADMRPNVWGEILRPALAVRSGWAMFIGTPKGVNLFSELYFRALKQEDGWKADMRRASETGVHTSEELEKSRREMTPAQFSQEMECDFAASVDNVLLRLEDILTSQKRILSERDYMHAPRIIGVDVARFGDDRTVLFPRQGPVAMAPKVFRGLDTMETADKVAFSIDRWNPDAVFVDDCGVGGGVTDRLRQMGHSVIAVNASQRALGGRHVNRRAEMWWNMADWVRSGGCLPAEDDLAQELTAPTYFFDANGRMQLESKVDMKGRGLASPDKADALALTFSAPVRAKGLELPKHLRKEKAYDYDPYAGASDAQDYEPLSNERSF